jgi:anti-sigma B factor antagonist
MGLEIQQREREGIVILDLKGRIVMGPEATNFRDTVIPIATAAGARTILNMAEVAYVDSTGLGAMVFVAGSVNRAQTTIRLLAMNARNIELLVTTKLETMFENFMEEQDAINSFFPDRAIKKFDILSFVRDHQRDEGPK